VLGALLVGRRLPSGGASGRALGRLGGGRPGLLPGGMLGRLGLGRGAAGIEVLDEDVRGLDVAVDDAGLVRGGEGGGDLAAHVESLAEVERRALVQDLQVLAGEPLHRDVRRAFVERPAQHGRRPVEHPERDDAHDVGVAELAEDLPLAREPGQIAGIRADRRDDLQGDRRPREQVGRAIHDAHAPAADFPFGHESLGHHLARIGVRHGRRGAVNGPVTRRWPPPEIAASTAQAYAGPEAAYRRSHDDPSLA
jgi:hypothetical protein